MKTKFLKPLILILCLNLSCTKENITDSELNSEITNEKEQENPHLNQLTSKPISNNNTANTTSANNSTGFGFEDDDGNIFDGNNNNDSSNGYDFNYAITFKPGVTEIQKRELRIPYQIAGTLLFFEQDPNNPQKEIWYMNFNSITSSCATITYPDGTTATSCPSVDPYNTGDGDPPREDPILLTFTEKIHILFEM